MENKQQGADVPFVDGGEANSLASSVGLDSDPSNVGALSSLPTNSADAGAMTAPPDRQGALVRLMKRADIALILLLVAALIGLVIATSTKKPKAVQQNVNNTYSAVEIPLEGIISTSQGLDFGASSVTINGPLKASGGLVVSPSVQPNTPTAGQLYFDQNTNLLAYYNGTAFVPLSGNTQVVQTVGGASGQLTLGGGLSVVGNQLANAGVLSLGGSTGDIAVGNGLSITGNTLQNNGVVSLAAGTPNLVITNNGNGNFVISNVGAGTGTVTSGGGTSGRLALFTGSQNIEDSLLSQAGSVVTANGDVSVVGGSLTLANALTVANGGTGAGSLTANGVLVGNGVAAITSVAAGGAGLCLMSTAGAPAFAACPGGGGGVTSLNGLSGGLSIANASGVASTITIDDATTSSKGIASFNATNFTATGGAINTVQNIDATATPTFAGVNTNNITPSATLTVGANGQTLTLQGNATTTLRATDSGNTTTLSFQAPSADVNYRLATAGAGNYDICTTAGNCLGSGGSAPNNAAYLLTTLDGTLTNDRALTNGSNISFTDGGANGNFTIATVNNPTFSTSVTTPILQSSGALAISSAAGQIVAIDAGTTIELQDSTNITGSLDVSVALNAGTGNAFSVNSSGAITAATGITSSGTITFSGLNCSGNANGGALTTNGSGQLVCSDDDGGAGGAITGTGTSGTLPRFTGASTIGDSIISQSGTTITIAGDLALNDELTVPNGGTGAISFTTNGVLFGNNTGALQVTAAGTGGQVLIANSSGVPTFVSFSGDISVSNTGVVAIQPNSVALGTDTTGDYVVNLGTLTGLSTSGNSGEGSTPTLSVVYGSGANTAVQGNVSLTCPAGTGNLTGGGGSITLGTGGACGNLSTVNNPTFSTSVTTPSLILTGAGSNGTLQVANLGQPTVYTLPDPVGPTATICLNTGNCAGSGTGVTTAGGTTDRLAKFTGAQAIGDSIISDNGTTVTIGGILSVNTLTPTGAFTAGATSQTATLQGSVTTVTSTGAGNDIVLNSADTIELQDNTNVTGNLTASGNSIVQGGVMAIGTTAQQGALTLNDGNGETATISVGGGLVANTALAIPTGVGATDTFCLLTLANCAGAAATLQSAYNNSTSPEITLDATRGAVTIRDNSTPLGANLLEVQNNGGGTTYFAVTAAGISVTGTTTASGNINTTAGGLQTNSTTRIDNSGNATNIGNIGLSGAISGGTTYSGSGNINTTGGGLQTNSTTRVDVSGNLTNIGNITGTGAITIATSAGNDVIINGADEFIVQDASVFNAQTTFTTDVDLTLTDTEDLAVTSTVTGTNAANVINGVLANNSTSGIQNLALLQNAAGTGSTESLLVLDNTDTDTALGAGLTVISSAGGVTNALDVSDSDIVTALLFGANDITGTNFAITGSNGNFTSAGSGIVQGGGLTLGTTSQQGSIVLHDGNGETATISIGGGLVANTAIAIPTGVGANDTVCLLTLANCVGTGGGVSGSGTNNRLAKFTSTGSAIGDSTISDDGTNVTTSVDMVIQGGDLTVGTTSQPGSLLLHDGDGERTIIQAGDSAADLTFIFPTNAGSANECLKQSGTGNQLIWDACDGGGGGSSATLQTAYDAGSLLETSNNRDINIVLSNDTVDSNFDLVIEDGSTGYVSFTRENGVGTADPAQVILVDNLDTDRAIAAGIRIQAAAGGITTAIDASDIDIGTALSVGANDIQGTTGNIDFSNFDVAGASGNVTAGTYNGQTISATASLTGTLAVAGNTTLTGDLAVNGGDITASGALNISASGGTLTVGSTGQTTTLQGNAATTIEATDSGNTTTLSFETPTADVNYRFATAALPGNYDVCTTAGNCNGAGVTLQSAYNASTSPEITLDATRGGINIRDNSTPVGNLLEVEDNAGTTNYFIVNASGISVTGTATVSGNINTTGGTIQTNSTNRIDNSGNLVNIGNLTLSGAISGGTTYSGSGNINTTGGSLQTNSTTRIDNSGNLTDIGNLTATGAITIASTGAGNDIVINGADILDVQDAATFASTTSFNGVATFNTNVNYSLADAENIAVTSTITGSNSLALLDVQLTNNTTSGTQRGGLIQNTAGTGVTEALLVLDNADTDTATTAGLQITSATGTIQTAVDLSDADIVDALNVGANNIIGTTGDLNFSNFDVTGSNGNVAAGTYNGQTISSAASFTGTLAVAGNTTLTGDLAVNGGDITSAGGLNITPNGALVVGAASQSATLQGNASTTITATDSGNTTTLSFQTPTANINYRFVTAALPGNYDVCTTAGNCNGAGVTLQSAYSASTNPEIVLDATRGALTVRDNGTPLGANLLEIQNNAGSTTYFGVTAAGTTTTGISTVSGNINTTGGGLQTNSTTRIDVSGNLTNIGDITGTGAVTIASAGGGDVIIDGADQFLVQDAAEFTSTAQFDSNVNFVVNNGESVNISKTVSGTGGELNLYGGISNNTTSGTQRVALFENSGGSGVTDELLVLSNADVDTAVTYGLQVISAAGTIGTALDVSDSDIGTALAFGGNDIAGTNFSINGGTGDFTSAGDGILQGGAITLGTTSQQGTLVLHDGNGESATISVGSALTANTIISIPTAVGATDTFCLLTLANCAGAAATLQSAYTASSTPEITLDATRGAVTIRDNSTPIAANLFEIQNNAMTTTYLGVTASGISTSGYLTLGGGLAADLTTPTATTATAITIKPGTSSGASSNGAGVTVSGGDGSGTTSVTGGALTLQGGSATGGSGTRNGGDVNISGGTGANANGNVNIATLIDGSSTVQIGHPSLSTGTQVINIGTANTAGGTTNIVIGATGTNASGGTTTLQADGAVNIVGRANSTWQTAGGTLVVRSSSTLTLDTTSVASPGSIDIRPGTATATSGSTNIYGSDNSGTGGVTAGGVVLQAGNATGGSGTRNGGSISINAGTGATTNGSINIGTTTAAGVTIGNGGTTIALQGPSVTVGTASQQGTLVLQDGNGQTATIRMQSALTANTILDLPTGVSTADTICLQTLANCSGSATTLQNSYNADADGSDTIIALTTADDSLILRNPASNGTDSGYVLSIDQLNTGNVDGVRISSVGTGNLLRVTDATTTSADVLTIADTGVTTFKTQTNNANAFRILSSTNTESVGVDNVNSIVRFLNSQPGAIPSWTQNAANLPLTLYGMGTATVNGYVYIVGGFNGSNLGTDETYYAKVNANGSLSSWTAGTLLPANRGGLGVAAVNGYLYAMGGRVDDDGGASLATIYRAKINIDGSLGTWATLPNLTAAVADHAVVTANGYIYILGGFYTGGFPSNDAYYAKVNADGSLSSWTTVSNSIMGGGGDIRRHAAAVANGYVYVLGGVNSAVGVSNDVRRAKLNANGSLGTWGDATGNLVEARYGGTAVVMNGHIYYMGGEGSDNTQVMMSKLDTGGATGSFAYTTSMHNPRRYAGAAATNGYIYAMGGETSTIYNDIDYGSPARVSIGGSLDLIGVSGEDAADGGTGGNLTAGNTNIVGTLDVTAAANFRDAITAYNGLTVHSANNSAAAFAVLNATAVPQFSIDTTNSRVYIGNPTADTTGALLVLDTKSDAGDPNGVDGGMYYSTAMGLFRCYTDGRWAACNEPSALSYGYDIREDFTAFDVANGDLGLYHWSSTLSGSGTNVFMDASTEANRPGQVRMETGTTFGGPTWAGMYLSPSGVNQIRIGGNEVIEFALNIPTLSTALQEYVIRAGLCDQDEVDCTNGLYFEYDRAGAGDFWRYGNANGGTRSETTSAKGTAIGWTQFRIVVNSAASSVTYYVKNSADSTFTTLGSQTANIPTSNNTRPGFMIVKTAGTTERSMNLDYFHLRASFSTRR